MCCLLPVFYMTILYKMKSCHLWKKELSHKNLMAQRIEYKKKENNQIMDVAVSVNPRMHRIAVSIFFFISGLTFASWASRIPDIKEKLQLTEAGLGSVLFALPVGLMCSLPLSGWLVSKFGSRKV